MSEQIQSIAQNNYILATQQEVSHDNTLSGNGTVDSPLGVVPGYNETVLYSGDAANTYNLSESMSGFAFIAVDYRAWERVERKLIPTDNLNSNSFQQAISWGEGSNAETFNTIVYNYSANSDFTTIQNISGRRFAITNANSIANYGFDTSMGGIIKVIGINRKA